MLKEKPWNNFDYSPKGAVQAVWCLNNHLYSSNSDFFNDLIFKITRLRQFLGRALQLGQARGPSAAAT